MMTMGKMRHMRLGIAACITAVVMLFGYSMAAFANGSPTDDYVTDSSHILISAADSSIADVASLLDGDDPAAVLGDSSLKGYSTLTVLSVAAVGDYDYSEAETTKIRGASITSDMTIQVRFLPTDGNWEKIAYTVENDYLSAQFSSDGQLAIFALDETEIADEDGQTGEDPSDSTDGGNTKDTGKAPQTGDALPIILTVGSAALFGAIISYRRMHK